MSVANADCRLCLLIGKPSIVAATVIFKVRSVVEGQKSQWKEKIARVLSVEKSLSLAAKMGHYVKNVVRFNAPHDCLVVVGQGLQQGKCPQKKRLGWQELLMERVISFLPIENITLLTTRLASQIRIWSYSIKFKPLLDAEGWMTSKDGISTIGLNRGYGAFIPRMLLC